MQRQAIINSHTLGAIDAYRMVIKDISEALGDPVIDMQRMFYALMIQSGIERFEVPRDVVVSAPSGLSDRVSPVSLETETSTLDSIYAAVTGAAESAKCTEAQLGKVQELAYFLQDLHIAAVFCRPVVTALDTPKLAPLRGVLREDMFLVVDSLLSAVQILSANTPLTKLELPKRQVTSFREILESGLFAPYVESHSELESSLNSNSTSLALVGQKARGLVDAFPDQLDLKKTGINVLQAIPALIDALAGKVFGAAATPFFAALGEAIASERRVLVYSFHPVWRQVWESKLDKVRTRVTPARQER